MFAFLPGAPRGRHERLKKKATQHSKNTTKTSKNEFSRGPGPSLQKSPPTTAKSDPREAKMTPRNAPGGARRCPRGAKTAPRGSQKTERPPHFSVLAAKSLQGPPGTPPRLIFDQFLIDLLVDSRSLLGRFLDDIYFIFDSLLD